MHTVSEWDDILMAQYGTAKDGSIVAMALPRNDGRIALSFRGIIVEDVPNGDLAAEAVRLDAAYPFLGNPEACRAKAAALALATGVPIEYGQGGFSFMRGATGKCCLEPSEDVILAAWEQTGQSVWSQPDRSINAVGGSWWQGEKI